MTTDPTTRTEELELFGEAIDAGAFTEGMDDERQGYDYTLSPYLEEGELRKHASWQLGWAYSRNADNT